MLYHSHYSDETYLKKGVVPSWKDIDERQQALREAKLKPIGEVWVTGYGITLSFEGPELDKDTQNLLNVKQIEDAKTVVNQMT